MGAAASARKSQAAATANLAANSARTAALAATAFAAIRAKKVARDALKRARLMVSNNSSVVKVPLPHNAAAFDNFDTRNVIRCVEVLQQLLAEDMERVPAERLVKTHHTYAVADPDAGTTTEHRVSNPALECQELLVPLQALLEQGHRRIPQGNVRQRVTALILANYKTLLAQKLSFTQPLNVHEMTGVQPYLTNDHRRALLRVRGTRYCAPCCYLAWHRRMQLWCRSLVGLVLTRARAVPSSGVCQNQQIRLWLRGCD